MNLVEVDPDDGQPWDFSNKAKRDKVMQKVQTDKPFALIANPMCGRFSALQSLFSFL